MLKLWSRKSAAAPEDDIDELDTGVELTDIRIDSDASAHLSFGRSSAEERRRLVRRRLWNAHAWVHRGSLDDGRVCAR